MNLQRTINPNDYARLGQIAERGINTVGDTVGSVMETRNLMRDRRNFRDKMMAEFSQAYSPEKTKKLMSYIDARPNMDTDKMNDIIQEYRIKLSIHDAAKKKGVVVPEPFVSSQQSPQAYAAQADRLYKEKVEADKKASSERQAAGALDIAGTVTNAMKAQKQPTRLSYQQEAIGQAGGLQTPEGQPFSAMEKMGALTQAGKFAADYPTEYQQQGLDIRLKNARTRWEQLTESDKNPYYDVKEVTDDMKAFQSEVVRLEALNKDPKRIVMDKEGVKQTKEEIKRLKEIVKNLDTIRTNLLNKRFSKKTRTDQDAPPAPAPPPGPSKAGFDAWKARQGQ